MKSLLSLVATSNTCLILKSFIQTWFKMSLLSFVATGNTDFMLIKFNEIIVKIINCKNTIQKKCFGGILEHQKYITY